MARGGGDPLAWECARDCDQWPWSVGGVFLGVRCITACCAHQATGTLKLVSRIRALATLGSSPKMPFSLSLSNQLFFSWTEIAINRKSKTTSHKQPTNKWIINTTTILGVRVRDMKCWSSSVKHTEKIAASPDRSFTPLHHCWKTPDLSH